MTRDLVALAFVALFATQAQAQVRVGQIAGPGAAVVRRRLPAALEEAGVGVTDDGPAELSGRVRRQGRRYRLAMRLEQDGATTPIDASGRQVPALLEEVATRVRDALIEPTAEALEDAPPSPPPVRASAPPSSVTPNEIEPPRPGWGDDAMEYSLGLSWLARSLSFEDDLYDQVGEYALDGAPTIDVAGTWFPARHATSHPLAGLGAHARFHGAFGIRSATQDGALEFPTTVDEWAVGLLYRVRLHEVLRVQADLDYGEARFEVGAPSAARPGATRPPFPSTRYRYVRPAAGLWLDLPEGFSVFAGGAWRAVVDAGPIAADHWFPRASSTGLDVSLEVRWRFDRWFAVRVRGEHVRYLSALQPEPGDVLVAGGAADAWTRVGADLLFVLPGAP